MSYNTMSLVRPQPYVINNNYKGLKKKEENDNSQSSGATAAQEEQQQQKYVDKKAAPSASYQKLVETKAQHEKAVASRDANLKNATVNIAQILKDFKNTAKAIGAPPELMEEVNSYLSLIEKQVVKESPDSKLIRSNLKNASILLDNYITETLQRPSKVVENWIDALFLQQIDFRYNEGEVNPQFLVKFPNGQKENEREGEEESDNEDQKSSVDENAEVKTAVFIPEDEELKSLFLSAKKYSYANDTQKAMETFKAAWERAVEVRDRETESKILLEIGKIYDKNDYLAQALTSYNRSLMVTSDVNVKTQAHYSIAQIYDDVAQFEPAINHYMSSISYAGENENLTAQSTSLTKIGNIFADEYKKDAFDFLLEAENLASQTDSHKTKGYVSSNIANAYNKFNDPHNSLKYYSGAVKEYMQADSPLKVAINYKRAADLMKDFENGSKAKKLYQKALMSARQTDDVQLMTEIHQALGML